MQRFLHEVRSEFPAFETCIVGEHLLESYFVQTYKNNERIKRQSGAFLICGLDKERLSKKRAEYATHRYSRQCEKGDIA